MSYPGMFDDELADTRERERIKRQLRKPIKTTKNPKPKKIVTNDEQHINELEARHLKKLEKERYGDY